MEYQAIVKNPQAFRDALQQDDKLFDAVVALVECYADAAKPEHHHIAKQPSVLVTKRNFQPKAP